MLLDAAQQKVEVMHTLAPADDLASAFGRDERKLRALRVWSFRLQNLYDMHGAPSGPTIRLIVCGELQHLRSAVGAGPRLAKKRQHLGEGVPLLAGRGGIALLRSGLPFGVDSTANTIDSQGRQRANRVGDGRLDRDQRPLRRYFDTTAFVNPPQHQFGNSPRTVIRAPGLVGEMVTPPQPAVDDGLVGVPIRSLRSIRSNSAPKSGPFAARHG